MNRIHILLLLTAAGSGCASTSEHALAPRQDAEFNVRSPQDEAAPKYSQQMDSERPDDSVRLVSMSVNQDQQTLSTPYDDDPKSPAELATPDAPEDVPLLQSILRDDSEQLVTDSADLLQLQDIVNSVHRSFPLVQAAFQERQIANGNQLSTWGEFDTKIKASSESGPLGFYETYRNNIGFTAPMYNGGEVFGGYRNGGGDFQPWYEERETNDGGEFKAGVRVPLIRDREIDARRAALWRATYDQQIADPLIRAMLIQFNYEASLAYWKWIATGQKYRIGQQWLELARKRNSGIELRVQEEDLAPPELTDNLRAIAKRESKVADARRQLEQAAIKLSLYLRDESGLPLIPALDDVPEFPALRDPLEASLNGNISVAQSNRPELAAIELKIRQLQVDYAEACNLTRPGLDAQLIGSQDVGQPTSKKRDKSEFEVEAGLFFDVPLQRRKGRGKMFAVRAKINQISNKRRMVADKVTSEVQSAWAGILRSKEAALKAREAVALANEMARIEVVRFDAGDSDLLKVALREQYALEAAEDAITAAYQHFVAFSEFAAALSLDRPSPNILPAMEE